VRGQFGRHKYEENGEMVHGPHDRVLDARSVLRGLALLGTLLIAAGCGSSNSASTSVSHAASSTPSKPAKIAYLAYTIADYQQAMIDGMKSKVDPGGSVTVFNANYDTEKQLSQCQDAVHSGRYNIIVLDPITPPTGVPCAALARAAHLPVITLEFPVGRDTNAVTPTIPGVVKQIVTQPVAVAKGEVALVKLACAGKNPCQVAGEVATANDPITNLYLDEAAKLPNVKIVQRIATQYDPSVLIHALPDVARTHPGLDVFAAAADFGAIAAVGVLPHSVKILGDGASTSGVDAVKNGKLFGTIGTWPRQMGELAGTAAVQAANGQKLTGPAGVNAMYIDKPLVITKQNVEQMRPEWGAKS
jgi:ribose transport system substrate-binding protein